MGLHVFEIDRAAPHPGVNISADGLASRDTNGGWVTLRATQPLSPGCTQFAVRIVDQGDGSDGSGLMIGVVPRLQQHAAPMLGSKYISELGGWCLSRAGESYGTWKCEPLPYGTGSVIEFDVDVTNKSVHIVCGSDSATGHVAGMSDADELFPAISLYYQNQKVCFV